MNENASVQAELKKQDERWWEGVNEGFENSIYPTFWYSKPLSQMTSHERGIVLGILLRENERHYR